jgi:tetratricopeptide (TPR) repeat protein
LLPEPPSGDEVWNDVIRWADLALQVEKEEPRVRQAQRLLALAWFRAGRVEDALVSLDKSLEDEPEITERVSAWLLRAMVLKQVGRIAEARRDLAKATAQIDRGRMALPPEAFGVNPLGLDWTAWVTVQTWREQAEMLIRPD